MQKSKKFRLYLKRIVLSAGIPILLLISAPLSYAAVCAPDDPTCTSTAPTSSTTSTTTTSGSSADCKNTPNGAAIQKCIKNDPIVQDIQKIVNFLSAGVGIIVVAVIIVGGVQYSIAGDNPQRVTAAKQRIINALIALVAFIFMFAFLQWLIPGGIFS